MHTHPKCWYCDFRFPLLLSRLSTVIVVGGSVYSCDSDPPSPLNEVVIRRLGPRPRDPGRWKRVGPRRCQECLPLESGQVQVCTPRPRVPPSPGTGTASCPGPPPGPVSSWEDGEGDGGDTSPTHYILSEESGPSSSSRSHDPPGEGPVGRSLCEVSPLLPSRTRDPNLGRRQKWDRH